MVEVTQTVTLILIPALVASCAWYMQHRTYNSHYELIRAQVSQYEAKIQALTDTIKATQQELERDRTSLVAYKKRVKSSVSALRARVNSSEWCLLHEADTREDVYSPVVCRNGYHVRLAVALNGDWSRDTAGTHVGVWVYNTAGRYDGALQWPCPYSIHVELLPGHRSRVPTANHGDGASEKDKPPGTKPLRHIVRPLESGVGKFGRPSKSSGRNAGVGILKFIDHEQLRLDYLHQDTVHFKLTIK